MKHSVGVLVSALASLFVVVAGCDGSRLQGPSTPDPGTDPYAGGDGAVDPADPDAGADAAPPYDDGTPTRKACTTTFGTGLTADHGRLDGKLVTVVGADERNCRADSTHVHLQVEMKGAVYDIAVNIDGLEGEIDAPMPGMPYEEGWHATGLDYVNDLGLHSTSITLTSASAVRKRLESALAKANHVSIYGYGYPGADGAHIVHYNGGHDDGAIVVNPSAPTPHIIAFRFADDTF
ncbi:MAG: hypothetical protein JWP87_4471 [Labilithrix sp.]|nr:hypothetical protein [Labilithrix sp.]